jgi:hypothetical protein
VGRIFEPHKYAFALTRYRGLTGPLSVEIIGAYESGLVEALRKKYFGERY